MSRSAICFSGVIYLCRTHLMNLCVCSSLLVAFSFPENCMLALDKTELLWSLIPFCLKLINWMPTSTCLLHSLEALMNSESLKKTSSYNNRIEAETAGKNELPFLLKENPSNGLDVLYHTASL